MKNRIFIGEFIGSAFLVMIIVGSGIMAQNLTRDFAVMLLANTIATGAGLFVLINSIANIAGIKLCENLKNNGYIILGLYNSIGRIRTYFRAFIYKYFNKRIAEFLDPVLRKITKNNRS